MDKKGFSYRDFHPTDVIQIYDTPYSLERVDLTHVATRGTFDNLELWSYEAIDGVELIDFDQLLEIGFDYIDENTVKYRKAFITLKYNKPYITIKHDDEEEEFFDVKYLHELQSLYYDITNEELIFNIKHKD